MLFSLQPLLAQIIRHEDQECHHEALRPASSLDRLRDREPFVRGDRAPGRLHDAVEHQGPEDVARTDQGNDQVYGHGQPQVLGGVIAVGSKEGDYYQELHHQGARGWEDGTALRLYVS